MNGFKSLIKSIQWLKIMYLIFLIFLAKFSFLYGLGFNTLLSFYDVALFSLSTFFLYCSVFSLKYFFKNKLILKKKQLSIFKITSILFIILGFLIGVYLSFKINKPYFSALFILACSLTYIYAKYVEDKSFLNNLIQSFLIPFIILCVWLLDIPVNITLKQWDLFFKLQFVTLILLTLSFLGTLSEELLKDISNINKDNYNNYKTLPILFGRKRTKNIALILMVISKMLIISLALYFMDTKFLFYAILVFIGIPQLFVIYYTMTASTISEYKKLLNKRIVFFKSIGILGVITIAYYFKYVAQ